MLLFGACSSIYAQTRPAKIAKFNLEGFGWQPLPKVHHGERPGTPSRLVWVDHKDRVLVGFTARESTDLATRERPGLSLHILRFTPEGKVDLSLVLPTKDYFANGLYLGSNDQIIARANDSLQMLIAENQGTQAPAWKVLAPCSVNCRIHESPSRRTLVVSESRDSLGRSAELPTTDSSYTTYDVSLPEPRAVQTCPVIPPVTTRQTS